MDVIQYLGQFSESQNKQKAQQEREALLKVSYSDPTLNAQSIDSLRTSFFLESKSYRHLALWGLCGIFSCEQMLLRKTRSKLSSFCSGYSKAAYHKDYV